MSTPGLPPRPARTVRIMRDKNNTDKPDRDDVEDYGAEEAPDDSAPDIVKRGAEKDESDARIKERRDSH